MVVFNQDPCWISSRTALWTDQLTGLHGEVSLSFPSLLFRPHGTIGNRSVLSWRLLFELFKVGWFHGDDKASKLRHAFLRFKQFIRKHKIDCSQPPFKSFMYVTNGEEYCYFGSKASWHDCVLCSAIILISSQVLGFKPWTDAMLRHEAYNSRVMTSWLADECSKAYESHQTERMFLTYTCVHALHSWHCELEQHDRYLTQTDSYIIKK